MLFSGEQQVLILPIGEIDQAEQCENFYSPCDHDECKGHLGKCFKLADSVYEVCEVLNGHLVDEERHLARLARSLDQIQIELGHSRKSLGRIMRETIRRNHVLDGLVYLQISRGVAQRDFVFPQPGTRPTIVCMARMVLREKGDALAAKGIHVKTVADQRWKRVDIKTTLLLPSVLARQAAYQEGAYEAWLIDDMGFVTEGAASNAWIVDADATLITRPCDDHAVLRGVTRTVLLELATREGLKFVERAFSVAEAKTAREAFITGASTLVMPVVKIDNAVIADGVPGKFSLKLRKLFHTQAKIAAR